MRILFDRILRMGIKLCMLTGITFLVTACYAPANPPELRQEKGYQQAQQQMDQFLADEQSND